MTLERVNRLGKQTSRATLTISLPGETPTSPETGWIGRAYTL